MKLTAFVVSRYFLRRWRIFNWVGSGIERSRPRTKVVLEKEADFLPMNIGKWAANQDVVGIFRTVAIISTIWIFSGSIR